MIGYLIEQELGNLLPGDVPLATLLTMVEVDGKDPAFGDPTKFIGPVYEEAEARRLAEERGWSIKPDGDRWRRVVPFPLPRRIFEMRPIRWLLARDAIVICTGGGGIPTIRGENRELHGTEAVIDKDLAGGLLARELEADLYLMATDVDAVYVGWGAPEARAIKRASPEALRHYQFPAGSMGPKVEAACQFAERTGGTAAIGALADRAITIARIPEAATIGLPCRRRPRLPPAVELSRPLRQEGGSGREAACDRRSRQESASLPTRRVSGSARSGRSCGAGRGGLPHRIRTRATACAHTLP